MIKSDPFERIYRKEVRVPRVILNTCARRDIDRARILGGSEKWPHRSIQKIPLA